MTAGDGGGEADKDAGASLQCDNVMLCLVLEAPLRGDAVTLYHANMNTEIAGDDDVAHPSGDSSITVFPDISDGEQQERERLRKLNRERVRRYRLRHRKGANHYGSASGAAKSRKRTAGKPKPRASTSSQQYSQQAFFLFSLFGIIFLVVFAILRRKTPMSPFGDQDGCHQRIPGSRENGRLEQTLGNGTRFATGIPLLAKQVPL